MAILVRLSPALQADCSAGKLLVQNRICFADDHRKKKFKGNLIGKQRGVSRELSFDPWRKKTFSDVDFNFGGWAGAVEGNEIRPMWFTPRVFSMANTSRCDGFSIRGSR